MINKIIQFSLHTRLSVLLVAVLLLLAGGYTATRMEVDVFPDLTSPTVVVMTEASGMAAEEVERLVTFPIETALNGATDVRRVRSSSTTGFSTVTVEFNWGTDIYIARQIVTEKLAGIAERLPDGAEAPVLAPQSSLLGEVLVVGLTADSTSLEELRTLADWTLRPRLLSTGGVAQVTVVGGDIHEYQIIASPQLMRHYGVSLDELLAATQTMNADAAGGILNQYGNEYIVRGRVRTTSPEEMAACVIKHSAAGTPITLADVAEVRTGGKTPVVGDASVNGIRAVRLSITKQPSTGTLELTEQLDRTLADLARTLPPDVQMTTEIFRQSTFIESSVSNIERALVEGAVLVVVILMIFLGNIRTTLISLLAIPLSLLVSLLVLQALGFTLNTMSLGGMAIAIGSLVDDAIIDVENVFKRLRENHHLPPHERRPVLKVVYEASTEIRASIWNATLIIIVTFVPLFFLSGMEGRMLQPLGIAFIVSLFASTVVALTLTPVLCSYLLGGDKGDGMPKEAFVAVWLKRYYRVALEWSLRHKRSVVGAIAVLFFVALGLFFTLGHSFLPSFNEGSFTVNVSSLPGISLEESDRIGRQAEELLLSIPEIETVARKTGRAELDEHALGVNVSEIEAPFTLRDRSHAELLNEVREKLSTIVGANIEIGQPISHRIDAMLSGTQASIAIKLFGDDLNRMFTIGNRIKDAVSGVEGIADLNVEQQIERPEIKIIPKREMLAKYGISMPEFSEFITVNMAGETVSQVYEQGKSFDLVVRAAETDRESAEKIRNLMIDDADGNKLPLSYVADVVSSTGPNAINRENVKRKVVISANAAGRDLGSVVDDIRKIVDSEIDLPEGYHIEYGGQFESEKAAGRILFLTSLMSIIVIFLLLYMQFKSAAQSGVVLLNLPLALIGGVFALLFTTGEVSIPAIIGFISLFGIATRNGMLLISHYNLLREQGYSLYDSIIHGSLDRLNPILMTALSSALALIPLAVKGDLPGNEIQSPMAKVILGGLLSSTFLNGFIVPIMYWWLHRKEADPAVEKK